MLFRKIFKKHTLLSLLISLPFIGTFASSSVGHQLNAKQEVIQEDTAINSIANLISERLEVSKEIAIYKWNNKLRIDDQQEDKNYLIQIQKESALLHLDSEFTKRFFTAQLEASQGICIEYFENWVHSDLHKHEYAPEKTSLDKKLHEIDQRLLNALQKIDAAKIESLKILVIKHLQEKGFSRDIIDSASHF